MLLNLCLSSLAFWLRDLSTQCFYPLLYHQPKLHMKLVSVRTGPVIKIRCNDWSNNLHRDDLADGFFCESLSNDALMGACKNGTRRLVQLI